MLILESDKSGVLKYFAIISLSIYFSCRDRERDSMGLYYRFLTTAGGRDQT